MASVTFYEKPGCKGNARQRAILEEAGHRVETRNLLTEPWTAESLGRFVEGRPVAEWFNPMAPRIRRGDLRPEGLEAAEALALLMAEPLLIRRPLLESGGQRMMGWIPEAIDAWLGLPRGIDLTVTCGHHGAGHHHHDTDTRSESCRVADEVSPSRSL